MKMDELKKRKTPRYQSFDYNSSGVYFITICTQNRRCILSRIVGTGIPNCPHSELTKYGQIADKYIKQLNDFYHHLSVEEYVIMPNHIHLLLGVKKIKIRLKTDSRGRLSLQGLANILMRSPPWHRSLLPLNLLDTKWRCLAVKKLVGSAHLFSVPTPCTFIFISMRQRITAAATSSSPTHTVRAHRAPL